MAGSLTVALWRGVTIYNEMGAPDADRLRSLLVASRLRYVVTVEDTQRMGTLEVY